MRNQAPGPRGWKLFKTLMSLQKNPLKTLEGINQEYGDLVGANILGRSILIVSDPKYSEYILKTNFKNYLQRGKDFQEVRPVIGNGLLLAEGEDWVRQRRLISREFHRESVERFVPDISSIVEATLTQLNLQEQPQIFVTEFFMHLGLEIAAWIFLGGQVEDAHVFYEAIEFNGRMAEARIRSGIKVPRGCPLPSHRKAADKIKKMDQAIYKIIQSYKDNDQPRQNVLSRLIRAKNELSADEIMSDKQLRDEIVTLLLAGHETTASSLAWVFYNLSLYPQWQEELHQEVKSVCGDQPVSAAHLDKLIKVKSFFQESLRLFPTIANSDKQALNSDQIGGYDIPAGTTVNLSVWLLHRHPDYWQNPQKFDPTRFYPSNTFPVNPYAYLPFGRGARACIGELLATAESQILIASMLRHFTYERVDNREIDMEARITLVPKPDFCLILRRRCP